MANPIMTPTEIASIVNQAFPQAIGTTVLVQDVNGVNPGEEGYVTTEEFKGVETIDASALKLWGSAYNSLSSSSAEAQFKQDLITLVTKQYIRVHNYSGMNFSLVRSFDGQLGGILQKITQPKARNYFAKDDTEIFDLNGGETPDYAYEDFTLTAKYFNQMTSKMVNASISDKVFTGLFLNTGNLMQVINLIWNTIETEIQLHEDSITRMMINMSMLEVIRLKDGKQAFNLLQEYGDTIELAEPMTVEQALRDEGFHKYAFTRIEQIRKLLADYNGLFNFSNQPMETKDSDSIFLIHSDYVSNAEVHLLSGLFNEHYAKLSGYKEVSKYQGTGEKGEFTDTSSVKLKYTGFDGTEVTREQRNIIGTIFNKDCMAIYDVKRQTDAEYIKGKFFTKYFMHYEAQVMIDMDEDMVVFYMEDYTPSPE